MSYDLEKLKKKMEIAKYKLLEDKFIFFGMLCLYLNYYIKEDIGTACTDGKNIYFDPEYLNNISIAELKWIIAHEVMHVANLHIKRLGDRNKRLWNIATDYCIHSILKEFEDSTFRMASGLLYDSRFDGKSGEEIYQMLMNEHGKSMQQMEQFIQQMMEKLADSHEMWGQCDGKENKDGENAEGSGKGVKISGCNDEGDVSEQDWEHRIISSAKIASEKSCGRMPSYLREILVKIKPPRKDWRQLLSEFIIPEIHDYSFAPPDKRMYSITDCVLPDYNDYTDTVKNIVFFIDVSGSMSSDEINEVYSEVVGAINQFDSLSGYLGYFDTEVHNFKPFEDINDVLENKPLSGGGTWFKVCFKFLQDTEELEMENVAGIIMLTDGECDYEECEELSSQIPVLWIMTQDSVNPAPFGQTVYLRNDKENSRI
jgi:predicted metal-dependent peptidase